MPSINKIDSDIILNLKIVARGNLLKTIGVIINAQTKKIPITKYHFKFIKPQMNKDIHDGKVKVVIALSRDVCGIGRSPLISTLIV